MTTKRTGQRDRRISDVPRKDWPLYNITVERRKTSRRTVTETVTTTTYKPL